MALEKAPIFEKGAAIEKESSFSGLPVYSQTEAVKEQGLEQISKPASAVAVENAPIFEERAAIEKESPLSDSPVDSQTETSVEQDLEQICKLASAMVLGKAPIFEECAAVEKGNPFSASPIDSQTAAAKEQRPMFAHPPRFQTNATSSIAIKRHGPIFDIPIRSKDAPITVFEDAPATEMCASVVLPVRIKSKVSMHPRQEVLGNEILTRF